MTHILAVLKVLSSSPILEIIKPCGNYTFYSLYWMGGQSQGKGWNFI